MSEPIEHTPIDGEGNVIDERPAYDYERLNGADKPARAPAQPMPGRIAMALVKAARECGQAGKSGHGTESRNGYEREFSFSTIDDVLEAATAALGAANLMVYPMCIKHELIRLEINHVVSAWDDYHYQFMIVWADEEKGLAETWVCPYDTRHIAIPHEGGKTEGMAQSYALKHFLRGILRIKTGELDAEAVQTPSGTAPDAREPVRAAKPRKPPPTKNAGPVYPFDFGRSADPGGNGLEEVTAEECWALFERIVKPLSGPRRKQWKEVNRIGLEQLCGTSKSVWLQIQKELEGDR